MDLSQNPAFLPAELICEIADHLLNDNPREHLTATLHACSRVSKAFCQVFQVLVFARVELLTSCYPRTSTPARRTPCERLLRVAQSNPAILSYIQALDINIIDCSYLSRAPNDPFLPRLLLKLNRLSSFHIQTLDTNLEDNASWTEFTLDLKVAIWHVCSLPTLTTLDIGMIDYIPPSLPLAASNMKTLKMFSIFTLPAEDWLQLKARIEPLTIPCIQQLECLFSATTIPMYIQCYSLFFSHLRQIKISAPSYHESYIQSLINTAGPSLEYFSWKNYHMGASCNARDPPLDFSRATGLRSVSLETPAAIHFPSFSSNMANTIASLSFSKLETLNIAIVVESDAGIHCIVDSHGEWGTIDVAISSTPLPYLSAITLEFGVVGMCASQCLETARKCVQDVLVDFPLLRASGISLDVSANILWEYAAFE